MNKKENLLGKKYGKLLVTEEIVNPSQATRWICVCDCGTSKSVLAHNLKTGNVKSCGCLARQKRENEPHKIRHGLSGTAEYRAWRAMKQRCKNPKNPQYKHYGGRGITVCDSWDKSFSNFIQDMGHRPDGKSLDRIDNNLGYEKDNCKWSTIEEQLGNRRITRKISFLGDLVPVSKVAMNLGVSGRMIINRLDRGLSETDAVGLGKWVRPSTSSMQTHL